MKHLLLVLVVLTASEGRQPADNSHPDAINHRAAHILHSNCEHLGIAVK